MEIVTQVTKLLQGLFDEAMDAMARQAGCVKRERKLSGSTLLSTFVLTMVQNQNPFSNCGSPTIGWPIAKSKTRRPSNWRNSMRDSWP